MGYQLEFDARALEDWKNLDNSVRLPLRKKLENRLLNPHVPNDRLFGELAGCYKIKNNKTAHRLVYKVFDDENKVVVVSIASRAGLEAYKQAAERLLGYNLE